MKYLLDTDFIIQALGGNKKAVISLTNLPPEEIAISYISLGEIYEGAFAFTNPKEHLKTFKQFLTSFSLLNLNEDIMEQFAENRSYLRRRGELIPDFDILIGTTAVHYNLTLLTYNFRHLDRIPELKLHKEK